MFCIITTGKFFAQEVAKTDTSGYKFRKNELGLNFVPLVGAALGGFSSNPQYALSYKHIFKGSNAFRINVGVQLYVQENWQYSSPNMPDNYELVSQSLTTEIRRYSESISDPKYQLGIGYERRVGNHRLSRFYGADLIMGRSSRSYSKKDYFMVLDSAGTPYSNGPSWIIDPNNNQPSTAFDSRTNSFYFGLSPFYGFRYPITKRLIVTAQMGFDASIAIGNYQSDDYANNIHLSGMVTTADFNIKGLISDLSLVFRF